jgi:pilus assembly protein Flp/PilA
MRASLTKMRKFLEEDRAATMVEYALMVSLIAMVAFASVVLFGDSVKALYQHILDEITAALS